MEAEKNQRGGVEEPTCVLEPPAERLGHPLGNEAVEADATPDCPGDGNATAGDGMTMAREGDARATDIPDAYPHRSGSVAVARATRIGARMIPLDDLLPHPLNANVMPDDLREKLRAHIKRTGRYPFLVVRPHPQEPGKFQVLDGHHRVQVLRELGHREARCDVWDVDDREAKLLLATLNRLEGQDVPMRRAQLLHELLGEMSMDDLAGLLPETNRQLEDLHALLEFPADEVAALLDEQADAEEKVLPRVMSFVVTPEQEQLIEQAVETASDGTPGRDRKARGLANLARHYLEGRDAPILE